MWSKRLNSARSDEHDEESLEFRENRARNRRRWVLIGLSGAIVLSLAGFATYRFGGRWLERRTRDNVRGYLEEQDYRRAQLMLEQAVQVSPHNVAARRALAEFYDVAGSPLAVEHWRGVLALAPNDDEVRLKLASAALRLEGPVAAREALAGVSSAGQRTLDYYRVVAGIALLEKNTEELQRHLEAMAVLEPGNLRTKISLTSLQLRSSDPAIVASARAELERVARGENFRIRATLALLKALPRTAGRMSPEGVVAHVRPDAAEVAETSEIFALAEHMKAEQNPAPEDAAALADWMVVHGHPREALVWLATQSSAVQNAPPVLAARANAVTQLRDWNLLRQLIIDGAWGRVTRDAIELAFAARLQRERASVANAKETFNDAIELAAPSLPTLKVLDRLCGMWGWPENSEQVLTRLVHDFPREQSGWLALLTKAEAGGKSARYLDLARRRAQALPEDLNAQGLRAYAEAIMGQLSSASREVAVAALVKPEADPEALAAGLFLRWQEKSATDALTALSPRQIETLLRSRKGALIYGGVLAAAGKNSQEILSRVASDTLLPEERALLPRSRASSP